MVPRDAMISHDETERFAREVIDCIARHGHMDVTQAQHAYEQSILPEGLRDAPDYYLHESPYYWAMQVLTGNRSAGQGPSPEQPAEVSHWLETGAMMTWGEVQQLLRTTALPVRFINWKGKADCPEVAWIITTLDGEGNKLKRPDRLSESQFLLSAEDVSSSTVRMLNSRCGFPLHIFKRVPGRPVRYQHLGVGRVIEFDSDPAYPHWVIELSRAETGDARQLGS